MNVFLIIMLYDSRTFIRGAEFNQLAAVREMFKHARKGNDREYFTVYEVPVGAGLAGIEKVDIVGPTYDKSTVPSEEEEAQADLELATRRLETARECVNVSA